MQIPKKVWQKYKDALAAVDQKAAAEMEEYIRSLGEIDSIPWSAVQYAAALTDVYGEAAGAAACEMYDATAEASGAKVKPAEMAELPKIGDVAKVVRGAYKNGSEKVVPGAVGRLVKQVGADTTLKNAQRDGTEFAWIPAGDTCAFCLTLASRGWQKISKKSLKNGHAEHIHANCDCAYCVRFDKNTTVEGYDPEKYREMYDNAEGDKPEEKINSMRRENAADVSLREKSKRKYDDPETVINSEVIESNEYHRAFQSLGESPKVTRQMWKGTKQILDHRSGSDKEDLIFIDSRTGKMMIRDDYDVKRTVMPSKKMRAMVNNASNDTIISIHNHPGNSVPSLADLKSAYAHHYKYGLVACHNGKLFKYSVRSVSNLEFADHLLDNLNKLLYDNTTQLTETERAVRIAQNITELRDIGVYFEVL